MLRLRQTAIGITLSLLGAACAAIDDDAAEPAQVDETGNELVAAELPGSYSVAFTPSGYGDGAFVHLEIWKDRSVLRYRAERVAGGRCAETPCSIEASQNPRHLRAEEGVIEPRTASLVRVSPKSGAAYELAIAKRARGLRLGNGASAQLVVRADSTCTSSGQCGLRHRCSERPCDIERPGERCPADAPRFCGDLGPTAEVIVGDACSAPSDCASGSRCERDPSWICDVERPGERCPAPPRVCVTRYPQP